MMNGGKFLILDILPIILIVTSLAFRGVHRIIYFAVIVLIALPLIISSSCRPAKDLEIYEYKVVQGPFSEGYTKDYILRSNGVLNVCVKNWKFFEPFYIKTAYPITDTKTEWIWFWQNY